MSRSVICSCWCVSSEMFVSVETHNAEEDKKDKETFDQVGRRMLISTRPVIARVSFDTESKLRLRKRIGE